MFCEYSSSCSRKACRVLRSNYIEVGGLIPSCYQEKMVCKNRLLHINITACTVIFHIYRKKPEFFLKSVTSTLVYYLQHSQVSTLWAKSRKRHPLLQALTLPTNIHKLIVIQKYFLEKTWSLPLELSLVKGVN